ncbi:DUF1343 domain-containing protein [Chlamydia sp. 17-3921]|uniref:DUF1343 domain-containing protein n=1 Tax=Chlamydia sp. 17-3921 TaxID=2675798 RepID=UPI00191B4CC5|nr:exo-beta-N-acetylmuramidase NamZ domain-containing protein [Chlamydia sp. 17-3921]
MRLVFLFLFLTFSYPYLSFSRVLVGLDRLFTEACFSQQIRGRKVVLISHRAAINAEGKDAFSIFHANNHHCFLQRLCTLEHGYYGAPAESFNSHLKPKGVPTVSLYGLHEIPLEVVQDCDVLVYDVQDIGVRSYSFISVLLLLVQASEKYHKQLIVLDRPNPMGGKVIDGPMPKSQPDNIPKIPYCYGMTPGELALFFKRMYAPQAEVLVVPMKGWKRSMSFDQTGLVWIPPSPNIPEAQSSFFYAATGIIGSLSITNIGVGYTLPFKVIGAPWMDGEFIAKELNKQNLPGISFLPFCYEPFFGKYKMEMCSGVLLILQDHLKFLPVETLCTILGMIKTHYPKQMAESLSVINKIPARRASLCRILGDEQFLHICQNEPFIIWPLRKLCLEARESFQISRAAFLLPDYAD